MTFNIGDELDYKWFNEGTVKVLACDGNRCVIEFPDGSFDVLQSSDFPELTYPKPEPKFKVGDKVQNGNHDKLTIHSVIEHTGEFFYTVTSKNNQISFVRENTIELAEEKPPFPRVGAWIYRMGSDDAYYRRITRIVGDCIYYTLFHQDGHDMSVEYGALASSNILTEVENPFK